MNDSCMKTLRKPFGLAATRRPASELRIGRREVASFGTCRVIKHNTGLMACRCSACTPKDTRILRFLPPSRPPNFYDSLGQITTYIHFFTFSKLSMLHHKKSSKMHISFSIFAILTFIESNQKHDFLLQNFFRQNRDSHTV